MYIFFGLMTQTLYEVAVTREGKNYPVSNHHGLTAPGMVTKHLKAAKIGLSKKISGFFYGFRYGCGSLCILSTHPNLKFNPEMRTLLLAICTILFFSDSFAQTTKIKNKKYPSLLWEITGKGMKKPSYLFGTMHVSSKMVFHLSDSFYLGIKNADVVALETNPGTWQDDFSRYDLESNPYSYSMRNQTGYNPPSDFFLFIP